MVMPDEEQLRSDVERFVRVSRVLYEHLEPKIAGPLCGFELYRIVAARFDLTHHTHAELTDYYKRVVRDAAEAFTQDKLQALTS